MSRIVVAITGASGACYGVRLLEVLKECGVETYLVVSRWGQETLRMELGVDWADLARLATRYYEPDNLAAPIASGSFLFDGMVISPCSMKTAAAIAHGYANDLITRAADVCLKEGRKLVLMPRESPLSPVHLENLLRLARLGATIMPLSIAFYARPQSIEECVTHTVGRVLDQLRLPHQTLVRWGADGSVRP